MKNLKLYLSILAAGIIMVTACTKEQTESVTKTVTVNKSVTDGQAKISGTVKYFDNVSNSNLPAPNAIIQIASDTVTKVYNQFWAADTSGYFSVKGLGVGSYYLTAIYTDKMGYKYFTNGFTVRINNSIDSLALNFVCK